MDSGIIILEGQYLVTFPTTSQFKGLDVDLEGLAVATLFCG